MDVRVEPLREADIPACLEIYNHYVLNTSISLEEQALTLAQYRQRAADVLCTYPFIVARDAAGMVLGFAYLSEFNPRSAYRRSADLSIYVRENCLHAHIGTILLARIEELARVQGIANLISIITRSNERSCAFHEKHGFVLEGEIHEAAMKFGRLEDVCFYRKALPKLKDEGTGTFS